MALTAVGGRAVRDSKDQAGGPMLTFPPRRLAGVPGRCRGQARGIRPLRARLNLVSAGPVTASNPRCSRALRGSTLSGDGRWARSSTPSRWIRQVGSQRACG
ncbi:hypothetical protein ACW4TU_24555 [Streptomyces sp. QTS52]